MHGWCWQLRDCQKCAGFARHMAIVKKRKVFSTFGGETQAILQGVDGLQAMLAKLVEPAYGGEVIL